VIKTVLGWTVVVIGLLPVQGISAQDRDPGGLTITQCIEISLSQNPLWLSSEQDLRASLARIEQAKAFPQPSLAFDSDLQPSLLNFRRSAESYMGLSQLLEFPGRRSLRTQIARFESQEIMADRNVLKTEIVYQIKEAFFSVLLAEEKKRYAIQNLDLARDFLQKAEVKYGAGDIAKVEIVRAGVEASKAATALTVAENGILLEKARLNFLLGRQKLDPLSVQGELVRDPVPIDIELLIRRAQTVRPEMARMKAQLDKAETRKKEAGLTYLPDFDLGLSRHRLQGERTTWNFTLSFPIPLFFWQPLRGQIAESRANLTSMERQAEHLENVIRLEVEQAGLGARAAEDQISLFRKEILAQAQEVYDLLLFSFQEGGITGIELIEARRTLIEALGSYADALYIYNITLAALEKSVGEPFGGGEIE